MRENLFHLWGLFLGTILGILPMINPIAAAPTFLAITEGDGTQYRIEQIRRACFFVVLILAVTLLCGSFVMNFFGISIPGLRIAGGIIVSGIGMRMVSPKLVEARRSDTDHQAALAKRDVSFSPLAMPILSGPGTIGVTIGFTSLASGWIDYVAILLGICVVAIVCYLVLRVAIRMGGFLSPNAITAITQVMGLIIMCMGVQFVVNGVVAIATDPRLHAAMRAAISAGGAQ